MSKVPSQPTQFSSTGPADRTLSGATTSGQSGSEGVHRIPQSSSITGTSLSVCLVSYPGHSFGGEVLPLYREAVSVFQLTGQAYVWVFMVLFSL